MNTGRVLGSLAGVLLLVAGAPSQVILSVDFNDRSGNPGDLTQPGFDSFLLATTDGPNIQTNASTAVFGALTVSISGNGSHPGYDDRQRTFPIENGDFNQSLLLRDLIFSPSTAPGAGLNVTVEGLNPNETYQVTIWSYDDMSTGAARVSDWSANGLLVRENYTFSGGSANRPTNNTQYTFTFKVTASPLGRILIEGRRDGASGPNPAVFLNALQVERTLAEPPRPVVYRSLHEVYAGDNTVFWSATGGTPPFQFQWLKNGAPIDDATNSRLTVFDTQLGDIGHYALVASNASGVVTSEVVSITGFLPVTDLFSGVVAHWPLDQAREITPDMFNPAHDLQLVNMTPANLTAGYSSNALAFDGVSQLATRTHASNTTLPIYSYPAYTVAFWVKGNFNGQQDRRIFSESSHTNNATLFSIGTHNTGTDGTVDIFIRNNDNSIPVNHRHSTLIAFDDQWHHVAWVDNNGYPRLYVDGVLDATDFTYARGTLTPSTTSVGGLQRASAGNWFAGQIDQVALWRRSLSAAEVQEVFLSGPPLPLRIMGAQAGGGTVTLVFHTPEPYWPWQLVEADGVLSPTWLEVPNVTYSSETDPKRITAQFPASASTPRFYRVIQQPP